MKRFLVELSYNGTRYSGWQIQPTAMTIQEVIQKALTKLYNEPIIVVGCGRTDAGVHAQQFFAHFDVEYEVEYLAYKLNRMLGRDIAILDLRETTERFHARFSAKKRKYIYRVKGLKDPFRNEWTTFVLKYDDLDFDKMQAAASLLLNYTDFLSFCKTGGNNKTTLCTLTESKWYVHPETKEMEYHIAANRFLRGMVRLIVGMCLNVGLGKITLQQVKEAIEAKNRIEKSLSAPANGLSLVHIEYPEEFQCGAKTIKG